MGEALITRRGAASGRFATGRFINFGPTATLSVTGLSFQPKDIKLFRVTGNYVRTMLWSLFWKESRGIWNYTLESDMETLYATVTTSPDGFTIVDTQKSHRFYGDYYWFAFENEQEV